MKLLVLTLVGGGCLVALVIAGGFIVGRGGVGSLEVGVDLELVGAFGGSLDLGWGDVFADPEGDLVEGAELEDVALTEDELGGAAYLGGRT